MRVLLTGASGFIGQHVLSTLLAEGHDVVCAARHRPAGADPRVRWIDVDFAKDTDKRAWLARVDGIDAVINTVGIFREQGRQTFRALHVEAPCALFAACAESPHVRLVVQLSALGADAQAASAYHLSKKSADDYLASLPLRAFIVQPSLVYGKDGISARVFRMLASMPLAVRFGSAPQLVQPVHVDDVAAAVASLLRQPLPVDASAAGDHGSVSVNADVGTGIARRVPLVGPEPMAFTDYLALLRQSLGLGRLRVLRLPNGLARLCARVAGKLPGALLDPEALAMLDRGNSADAQLTTRLLGRPPRHPRSFIEDPLAERARAKLDWLLPVLRVSIAAVWIATAIVSYGLYPVQDSYTLLERTGVPAQWAPLMLYGAATFDLLLGLGILLLPRRRWLWGVQLLLIGFYTVVIAWKLPEFLLHPYGPLTKNLPMLAAIWLLAELEEN